VHTRIGVLEHLIPAPRDVYGTGCTTASTTILRTQLIQLRVTFCFVEFEMWLHLQLCLFRPRILFLGNEYFPNALRCLVVGYQRSPNGR